MEYSNLQPDSLPQKLRRNIYLIVSISLLTHTLSITYSLITFKEQSAGFISIIVSSLVCFFISSSHLTIYGISILGSLFIAMITPYYDRWQIYYIVALSGVVIFVFWKIIHSVGAIFHCLPGRIHASLVFGIALIVLSKLFPLAIENVDAFFAVAQESALESPFDTLKMIFSSFNILTLILTVGCICLMFLLRGKLQKIPLIGLLVLIGILANINHPFKSMSDLCAYADVNCHFYIINVGNLKYPPILADIIQVIPAALVMALIVIFEQFLYLEEFERRGRRDRESSLGEVHTQSKTLGLANIISGCLGGMPICINLFGTYENFAFNHKHKLKGTKWVGLMQIPFSYLLYSWLAPLFNMIPLFILFIVVATPVIYLLKNVLALHSRNLLIICIIAGLCVVTHPMIALVFATLVSIYDISELLKPAPAQMVIESINSNLERRSSTFAKVVQKQQGDHKILSQFVSRIIQIEGEVPAELEDHPYMLYRFIGSVSFLNYYSHHDDILKMTEKYVKPDPSCTLILSFRYAQIVDEQSLNEMAFMLAHLKEEGIKYILAGLHKKIWEQMQKIPFYSQILQGQQKCMYSLHVE